MVIKESERIAGMNIISLSLLAKAGMFHEFYQECERLYGDDFFAVSEEDLKNNTLEIYGKIKASLKEKYERMIKK